MKELKFRVWDGKKFHYTPDFNMHFSEKGIIAELLSGGMIFNKNNDIQQYTGIKDGKDKEIYEGDIMKFHSKDYENTDYDEVVFVDGTFCFKNIKDKDAYLEPMINTLKMNSIFFKDDFDHWEIIGNIYENPKLKL